MMEQIGDGFRRDIFNRSGVCRHHVLKQMRRHPNGFARPGCQGQPIEENWLSSFDARRLQHWRHATTIGPQSSLIPISSEKISASASSAAPHTARD